MSTTKIPQYGDPEILPKGIIRSPSNDRMPFTLNGTLKSAGPGPAPTDYLNAPDLANIPNWRRMRGDEWTTPAQRQLVFAWLIAFFDARKAWARGWEVHEIATADRSVARLPDVRLVIAVTDDKARRHETSISLRETTITDDQLSAQLSLAAQTLDALYALSVVP